MPKNSFASAVSASVLAVLCCPLTGCDTPTGQGAGIGAVTGAAIGGLATNRAGGAALGAVTGALAGSAVEEDRTRDYGSRDGRSYPEAVETDSPGYVISPYEPHHEIDVRGIPEGALVRDPSCNRLFVNP